MRRRTQSGRDGAVRGSVRGSVRGRWWELVMGASILSLCGVLVGGPGAVPGAQAAPWNQDEDLAALGSLDSLLAYEDLQQAVQQAEDGVKAEIKAPWLPAEPDPQLYLLTEYDRGGQARVKRNRETGAVVPAVSASKSARLASPRNLHRHVRNPPSSSGQRLSIVNPLDVLRQRLLLEIARRRKASVPQTNREMLEGIGKRSWNSANAVASLVDQQLERCLTQLSDTLKPQDKLTRLAILYKAIEYGKCNPTSDSDEQQPDQRIQQQQVAPPRAQVQEQGESNHNHLREDQDEWSASRQQANGWSRNARAASSSNLSS